jgi:hypothetical protein
MKRSSTLVMALAVLVALAAPAGAAKGGNPSKPDKPEPPGLAILDVTMTANLFTVNIPLDEIGYTVTVTNTGSDEVAVDDVVVTVSDERLELERSLALPAGETWLYEEIYEVQPGDFVDLLSNGDWEPIALTVTVTTDDADTVTASDTVEVWPVEGCQWDGDELKAESMSEDVTPCYWDPADHELWTLTATSNTNKRTKVGLTVRDHFPGNWCVTPEELDLEPSGAITGPAVKGPVELYVHFPADGICLAGGAGGEEMGVGTYGTYYVWARGDVTVVRAQLELS